ncbi:MAG TPA: DUF481 domain-containing protein [Vicinamibacterales bacterium]|nr:DUF481 domain-containing protein [Vicinamibacterales bacterium]
MPNTIWMCVLALIMVASTVAAAQSQTAPGSGRAGALRVFLDCDACDENYFRTEITFVDYVRDRTDADVHVLVTTQGTGGGGIEYTVKYIGLGRFSGVEQSLKHFSAQTETDDERRSGLAATLRLGLVRYAAETPLAARLKVSFDAPAKTAGAAAPAHDPWNFWIFRIGSSGSLEGEESENEKSFRGSISANRTTNEWKLNFNAEADYSQEEFVLDEGETFRSVSRNIEANALVAKSLTTHWSTGTVAAFESSIFSNYELRTRLGGGIEYDVFPYAESTRRLLTVLYTLGWEHADYLETTIYGKDDEDLMDHRVETTLNLQQPWGSASASFEVAQYLTQPGKYRLTTVGSLEVRLFKGFSVDLFAEASRRRDQLSLRRGDATNEEILVRQRELATGYQYDIGFGISYSFGSIFNNVVNPRFRNAGGF